jgi:hypothetical protein
MGDASSAPLFHGDASRAPLFHGGPSSAPLCLARFSSSAG